MRRLLPDPEWRSASASSSSSSAASSSPSHPPLEPPRPRSGAVPGGGGGAPPLLWMTVSGPSPSPPVTFSPAGSVASVTTVSTTEFHDETPPQRPARRISTSRACFHCKEAHRACSRTRPCNRCILRNLECVSPPKSSSRRRNSSTGSGVTQHLSYSLDLAVQPQDPIKKWLWSPAQEGGAGAKMAQGEYDSRRSEFPGLVVGSETKEIGLGEPPLGLDFDANEVLLLASSGKRAAWEIEKEEVVVGKVKKEDSFLSEAPLWKRSTSSSSPSGSSD